MPLSKETDRGTPAREGAPVRLRIGGVQVTVPEGASVMRAASGAEREITKLCATEMMEAWGSCRLRLAEIEGAKGTPASCTTPVREGMRVAAENARPEKPRRGEMERCISHRPPDCLTCRANGDCELQDMAAVTGLRKMRYGMKGENRFEQPPPIDLSNPCFQFVPSECIACSRRVRACEEVQGTFALTMEGRGFETKVPAGSLPDDFFSSDRVSCGACVQACPTAAPGEKSVAAHGAPARRADAACACCGVGCSFRAELQGDEAIRRVPSRTGGGAEGHSCMTGRFAWGCATHRDRRTEPMIRDRTSDPWRKVGWEGAIAFAAGRLKDAQARHGQGAIGGITSSRCTNEEVHVVRKTIRAAFGNNDVDACARVCRSSTGCGPTRTFGTCAGTRNLRSVGKADVILLIWANPTGAHPVFASRTTKRLGQGAKRIVLDPRRIDLVRSPHVEAAQHVQLRPGTDAAVTNAFAHVIAAEGLVDERFVAERCDAAEFARRRAFVAGPRRRCGRRRASSPRAATARSTTASA